MKDWIVAILIAWLIYVYIFGGSLAGLGQLITGARNAVSQHDPVSQSDGRVSTLYQERAAQPQTAPQAQPAPSVPNWGPQGLPPVQADTPPTVAPTPDQALGSKGGYFVINGYRLYCDLITEDLQYTGDEIMKQWWDRLSPEMRKIQKDMC